MIALGQKLALFALLAGCGGAKDSSSGDGDGSNQPDGSGCETTISLVEPVVDGATDHYYLDPVVFELSEPDPSARFEAEFAGETTVSEDGLTVTYTPDEPLSPSTTYTITLDYCRGAASVTFTTSHFGTPLEASTDLEDAAYTLAFTGGEMLIGQNAGELMNSIFRWPILVQIQEAEGAYLTVMAAIGKEGVDPVEQNTCARTLEVDHIPTAELPFVAGRLENTVFGAHGGQLRFESFEFDATIAADGESIGGVRYMAVLGVAEVVSLLPDFGNVDQVCTLAANLDIPCEACPSDDQLSCIRVSARHIPGVRIDTSLIPIAEAETHEDCEPDA